MTALLASAFANAQVTPAAAQTSVELIALLKPSITESVGVPAWASNSMASAAMRARLGQPLEMQTLFPAASVVSKMRSTDPNLPMNRLNRYVKLRFPSLTSAIAMRHILLGNGLFEHVEVANVLQFDYTAIQVPEPYFQFTPSGTASYSYPAGAMLNNPYGSNAAYLPPDRTSWAQEQSQWYLAAMNFPQAWDLMGDDAFDNNPSAGFYGNANVGVMDSGLDPECDPQFRPVGAAAQSCFDSAYPAPTGNSREVLPPHAQLRGNLRRMQSFSPSVDPAGGGSTAMSADIIDTRHDNSNLPYSLPNAGTPLGVEGNPNRRQDYGLSPLEPDRVLGVGHGTHVAGLIAAAMDGQGTVGTCPTCSLNFFKRSGASDDVILQLATRNGVQVINMSYEGSSPISPTLLTEMGVDSPLSLFATALSAAADSQIFLVGSAGNKSNAFVESTPQALGTNLPASHPRVLAAGGSMADYSNGSLAMKFWTERTAIPGARCGLNDLIQCGSAYTTSVTKKMLYAPAAHILSTMYGAWGPSRIRAGKTYGLAGCTHELFPADAQPLPSANYPPPLLPPPALYPTGNYYPSFDSHYGMCTGTSMSAPILSGLAGLVRSVNPLLNIDDTYTAMQNQAVAIGDIPQDAQNTRQPLADKTLEKALGQFGGAVARNRLVPMFAARSSVRDDGTPNIDWVYSTKPQMLRAAMLGDLYFNNVNAERAGTRHRVNYDASTGLPPVAGYGYGNALKTSANTPHGSFYVFATQRRPIDISGPSPLVPLYRMVTDSPISNLNVSTNLVRRTGACDARKHTYATPGSLINGQATQSYFAASTRPTCFTTASDTIPSSAIPPAANLARYSIVTIEGFIYSPLFPQPKGTEALYLRYSPAVDSFALVTASDVNRPDYVGYGPVSGTETVLGYVYENDALEVNGSIQSSDGDDWPANWELAMGLNADRADSDCDGVSDSVEFPLAALPLSDPKQNTCTGNNIDSYAVAAIPQVPAKAFYRLRNYTAAASNITFKVYDTNGGAHNVALNSGAAICTPNKSGTLPHNMTIWTCTLNLAPGVAGNEAVSLDYGSCNTGNALVSRVEILSPDGYTVNNDVTVHVCP